MIIIIAAIGNKGELGKDNQLLWHLPNDLKRFKRVTRGHPVIMGRKTFESLGSALPDRKNIVITRKKDYDAPNCIVVNSLKEAQILIEEEPRVYILGGAQIYAQAIKLADMLDLTQVDASFDADVFFPEIDNTIWQETSREDHLADDKHRYNYSFVIYEKRK